MKREEAAPSAQDALEKTYLRLKVHMDEIAASEAARPT